MSAIKWFSCRAPAQNHHHVSSISRSFSAAVTPELCELGKNNMSKALLKAGPGTPRAWRAALRGGPAFFASAWQEKAPSLLRLRKRRGYLALGNAGKLRYLFAGEHCFPKA